MQNTGREHLHSLPRQREWCCHSKPGCAVLLFPLNAYLVMQATQRRAASLCLSRSFSGQHPWPTHMQALQASCWFMAAQTLLQQAAPPAAPCKNEVGPAEQPLQQGSSQLCCRERKKSSHAWNTDTAEVKAARNKA